MASMVLRISFFIRIPLPRMASFFNHNGLMKLPSRNCGAPGSGNGWLAVLARANYTVFSYSAFAWQDSGSRRCDRWRWQKVSLWVTLLRVSFQPIAGTFLCRMRCTRP
jgi:hypothetical protein